MDELESGGKHWLDQRHVDRWDAAGDLIDTKRKEPFERLLAQLPVDRGAPLRFLDLGAGDGRVAALILDRYLNASGVLVDFSPAMIEKGERRLARFGSRYTYHVWDMSQGSWPVELRGPFDAVVSSAAIHHLENDRKAWLAQELRARLRDGAVFANYDLFRDPAATFEAHEVHDRTCASLDEAIGHLEAAGFESIVVEARVPRPQSKGEQALLAARRPR